MLQKVVFYLSRSQHKDAHEADKNIESGLNDDAANICLRESTIWAIFELLVGLEYQELNVVHEYDGRDGCD